jgi:hypothetical protein
MATVDYGDAMTILKNLALWICLIWYIAMAALMLAKPELVARYVARSKMWTTYLTKVRGWSSEEVHSDELVRLIRVQGLLACLPIAIAIIVLVT